MQFKQLFYQFLLKDQEIIKFSLAFEYTKIIMKVNNILNFSKKNSHMPIEIMDHEISIVLQGPVYKNVTKQVIDNIRYIFPASEVILSTWKGADINNLDYDIVVLNDDPGGTPLMLDGSYDKPNNQDRMIVSTKNGIKKASRKYTLKWRTDLLLKNKEFLKYFDIYDKRSSDWKIFKKRVLINYSVLPYIYPLGPTDISCFGLTEDILIYWDLPLQTKDDAYFFVNNPYPEERLLNIQNVAPRIGAEMYVWYNVLKKFESKYGKIKFEYSFDFNQYILKLSELSLVNNLQILSREQFDYEPLVHAYIGSAPKTFITQELWMHYYKKYCVKNIPFYDFKYHFILPFKLIRYKFKYIIPLNKLLKNITRLRFKKAWNNYITYKKLYFSRKP